MLGGLAGEPGVLGVLGVRGVGEEDCGGTVKVCGCAYAYQDVQLCVMIVGVHVFSESYLIFNHILWLGNT